MDGSAQLTALADPTRRAIFEYLIQRGPSAVGEIARAFPVSRPAVSQHLKALVDAGLAVVTSAGTRRIYAVDPTGTSALHRWIDARWQHVLDQFARAARQEGEIMSNSATKIPPVQKTCTVPLATEAAFELFTARMGEWWPVETHSISADAAAVRTIRFDGRVGGRVVEVTTDGQEFGWADVIAWNPPARFVLSWHPTREPLAASRLEVTFQAVVDGTEVVLLHSSWEEFGEDGVALRDNYDTGWDVVLKRLEEHAGRDEAVANPARPLGSDGG
ncbi:MAG TPA: metalloregulator ArsR/SmtB family transcription factor [Jiangellaceae bacterium]|nr:metalloregulator ArsR/SmtB family transcription factor [Jiangellaceae bacterium]